jgi:tetratricopeptide (TPR) repeat protein
MIGLLLLVGIVVLIMLYHPSSAMIRGDLPVRLVEQLDKLWSVAQDSLQEKKYVRAEKALLTILRFDERNATAYNRLGILYARQRDFKEAIECFEIAQSLAPSASSLHNVGLIYFETGDYIKAGLAFEQALELENDIAARHIAYAKVQEKLGSNKKMILALERAVELEPNPQSLAILADAYERDGRDELALDLREKAARLVIPAGAPKRIKQPRKVIM